MKMIGKLEKILFKFDRKELKQSHTLMVAELESISYDDGGGVQASYVNDSGGFWHFHPFLRLAIYFLGLLAEINWEWLQ